MDAVVAELIDESNKWKEDLIMQSFTKEAAARILRTPLPKTPKPDKLIWHFDKHGIYSVKSGYQLAVNLKFPDKPSCSDSSKTMWKVIWANDIPEKVKIFMWRAAKNMLPTVENLWKTKIVGDPVCQRCRSMSEDVFHALVGCKFARKVWKMTEFYEEIKRMAHQDMLSVLQELAMKRRKKDIEQIIAVCWAIWYSRNCFVFEGKKEDPLDSATRAEAIVESYRRIKSGKNSTLAGHQQNKLQDRKPPPPGWFKVNVDAATNSSKQRGGLGAVVRDSSGDFVAAAAQRTILKGNVADMAEAVLFGIQVAREANCAHLVIESDCKEVVELVLKRKSSLAEIAWT